MPIDDFPTVCFIGNDGKSIPQFTTKIVLVEVSSADGSAKKTVLYGCTAVMEHKTEWEQLQFQAQKAGLKSRCLGGAFVRMDGNSWVVYGTSEILGPCDKQETARLLAEAFPDYDVQVA